MQTVMLHDVDTTMCEYDMSLQEQKYDACSDVFYADDSLLLSSSPFKLQRHLDTLVDEGRQYDLELNCPKATAMRIGNDGEIMGPSVHPVQCVD